MAWKDRDEPRVCPKCGCTEQEIKLTKRSFGVYCKSCGYRIASVSKQRDFNKDNRKLVAEAGDRYATKKIRKIGDNTVITCDICGCLLHSSRLPPPEGQFDLLDAAFCPMCGNEFLERQKILRK